MAVSTTGAVSVSTESVSVGLIGTSSAIGFTGFVSAVTGGVGVSTVLVTAMRVTSVAGVTGSSVSVSVAGTSTLSVGVGAVALFA
jgi:hypothetical protein